MASITIHKKYHQDPSSIKMLYRPKITLGFRIRVFILALLCGLGAMTTLLLFTHDQNGVVEVRVENISPTTSVNNPNLGQNPALDKTINTGPIGEAQFAKVENGELILSDKPITTVPKTQYAAIKVPTSQSSATPAQANVTVNTGLQAARLADLGLAVSPGGSIQKAESYNVTSNELYNLPMIPAFDITKPSDVTKVTFVTHYKTSPITTGGLFYSILALIVLSLLYFTVDPEAYIIKNSHFRHKT